MDLDLIRRLVRIAAKHGFATTVRQDAVLVHIPYVVVATGDVGTSDEPVHDTRELMLALGY